MDLLLTHAYFLGDDRHEAEIMRPYPPLGLLYVASHLSAKGFDVGVFDTTFADREAFERRLEEVRPGVVGIYGNLMTRSQVLEMTQLAKARGALVVLGGPEPYSYAEEYLARGADVVVAGEGELTLEELLPHLARSGVSGLDEVAGVAYVRDDGSVVRTASRSPIADLDSQPAPDREAIDLQIYLDTWRRHHGVGSLSLITARGCPYECSWCSHGVFGYGHRRRSPQATADEVETIVERFSPDMLWYADDVFTINHKWIFEYAEELERRGLRVPFESISREDRLNEKVIEALARMGCRKLWIGGESGSQRVLDAMKRKTDPERLRSMIRLLQQHGIEAGTFIMLGYEGETVADIEETVEHLKASLPDEFTTTAAYPIKGTPYYAEVADRIVAEGPWEDGSDRDLRIRGRHSQRYYRHVTRWMVNEVAVERFRKLGSGSALRAAKAFINARVGRLGMRWTHHELDAR